jgi:ribokinase
VSRILNIGSINLDEVFSVPHFIRPAETMACRSYERFIGGKGNNQSTALGRAGAAVHHAGKVGEDGRAAIAALAAAGVDVSRVVEADTPTGRALIQVDEDGQNCIILYGGANRAITHADVDAFLEGWGKGDSVLFQNEVSSLGYAMERAAEAGLRVFFNPSPADEIIETLPLENVDCFILNEVEGAMLSDLSAEIADPRVMLAALRSRFRHADLVLTLGSEGVLYSGSDGEELAVAAERVQVVDTTAAGDTFTGYYIAAVLRGEKASVALAEATRAAAICVTRRGAAPSIPMRSELGMGR